MLILRRKWEILFDDGSKEMIPTEAQRKDGMVFFDMHQQQRDIARWTAELIEEKGITAKPVELVEKFVFV